MHLIGLVSDGGVHSGWTHLEALIELAAERGVADLVVHAFTDGRDTLPARAARATSRPVAGWCDEAGAGRIGSVIGRYFAMDRDQRWERIAAGATTCSSTARPSTTPTRGAAAAAAAYERDETDEFITATTVGDEARIRPGDSVIAFNFRPDRMREITQALADPGFDEIDRGGAEPVERYATLTEYEEGWPYPVAFPPARPEITLPHVIAARGGKQLHVAETEKYPHVTYFFGGGEEEPETGERRELVPSPRDVPTYDHKPRDERARGRRRVRRARGARTSRASGSSTSPTPTWSATPASSRRRSRRSRRSTRASATSSRRCRRRRRAASSPPTTATPTRCSSPTARRTPRTRSTRCR